MCIVKSADIELWEKHLAQPYPKLQVKIASDRCSRSSVATSGSLKAHQCASQFVYRLVCIVNGLLHRHWRCVCIGNCSETHQGCETVWNTNVQPLYRDLIEGTLTKDRVQSFCRLICLFTANCAHRLLSLCRPTFEVPVGPTNWLCQLAFFASNHALKFPFTVCLRLRRLTAHC